MAHLTNIAFTYGSPELSKGITRLELTIVDDQGIPSGHTIIGSSYKVAMQELSTYARLIGAA